jgi:hypothetical protein
LGNWNITDECEDQFAGTQIKNECHRYLTASALDNAVRNFPVYRKSRDRKWKSKRLNTTLPHPGYHRC